MLFSIPLAQGFLNFGDGVAEREGGRARMFFPFVAVFLPAAPGFAAVPGLAAVRGLDRDRVLPALGLLLVRVADVCGAFDLDREMVM